jgi:hypothetical protein
MIITINKINIIVNNSKTTTNRGLVLVMKEKGHTSRIGSKWEKQGETDLGKG